MSVTDFLFRFKLITLILKKPFLLHMLEIGTFRVLALPWQVLLPMMSLSHLRLLYYHFLHEHAITKRAQTSLSNPKRNYTARYGDDGVLMSFWPICRSLLRREAGRNVTWPCVGIWVPVGRAKRRKEGVYLENLCLTGGIFC